MKNSELMELYKVGVATGKKVKRNIHCLVIPIKNLEGRNYSPAIRLLTELFMEVGEPIPELLLEFNKESELERKLLRVLIIGVYNGILERGGKLTVPVNETFVNTIANHL